MAMSAAATRKPTSTARADSVETIELLRKEFSARYEIQSIAPIEHAGVRGMAIVGDRHSKRSCARVCFAEEDAPLVRHSRHDEGPHDRQLRDLPLRLRRSLARIRRRRPQHRVSQIAIFAALFASSPSDGLRQPQRKLRENEAQHQRHELHADERNDSPIDVAGGDLGRRDAAQEEQRPPERRRQE